jgi:hypothetical protein
VLRITVVTRPDWTTLALEGRLAGPWVHELARCWGAFADPRSVSVKLDGVLFIDAAGKALLRTMHEQGATLSASGCMTRGILEEIQKAVRGQRG